MAKDGKKKKGNYGKVLGFCAVVACVAALLGWGFGGGGFGLGDGGFGSGGNDTSNGANGTGSGYEDQNEDPPSYSNGADEETDDQNGYTNGVTLEVVRVIRVVRDDIFHGDSLITLGELEYILDELHLIYDDWELVDEQAISEVYDSVLALMLERGIDPIRDR